MIRSVTSDEVRRDKRRILIKIVSFAIFIIFMLILLWKFK